MLIFSKVQRKLQSQRNIQRGVGWMKKDDTHSKIFFGNFYKILDVILRIHQIKEIIMYKILFSILLVSTAISSELTNAKVGEYYEVSGNALALLREPKVSTNVNVIKKNIIVDLTDEKKNIQILKTKGIMDRYYEVNLIRDGKIKLNGWIWAKAINSYKKISKEEAYYYEKPKIYYEPTKDETKKQLEKLEKKDVLIGQWVDESPYALGIVTIIERDKKTIITTKLKTAEFELEAKVSQQGKNKRFDEVGNDFGEYYLLDSNGNLKLYDSDGFIIQYKKIK